MTRFWRRVRDWQKRNAERKKKPLTAAAWKAARDAVWGVTRRLADHAGGVRLVTTSGQALNPRRDLRREAVRGGIITGSGRQWQKLRKKIARDERKAQKGEQ